MCPAKPDLNIKLWLAVARHEKIVETLKSLMDVIYKFDTSGVGYPEITLGISHLHSEFPIGALEPKR